MRRFSLAQESGSHTNAKEYNTQHCTIEFAKNLEVSHDEPDL
jgi:hypothetical protein